MRYRKTGCVYDGTLVKLGVSDRFLELTTYNREYGRCGRFLISRERMERWQQDDTFFDADTYDFLSAWHDGDNVQMRITWLNGCDGNIVKGHVERITIPARLITECLRDNTTVTHLHYESRKGVQLDFSNAMRTIREICGEKRTKRAFIKGLSHNFQWKYGKTIRFYNDGGSSFFFREEGRGLCGGLILHRGVGPERPGQEAKVYYSVHT